MNHSIDNRAFVVVVKGGSILVDAQDAALASEPRWRVDAPGYVRRHEARVGAKGWRTVLLHRVIMAAPEGMCVDHIDGNPRNNTRANLRVCTMGENFRNSPSRRGTSRYKGVSMDRRTRNWRASIAAGGRVVTLGRFATEEEAARAYDAAAREHFGEFARVNFARPGEQSALREESAA